MSETISLPPSKVPSSRNKYWLNDCDRHTGRCREPYTQFIHNSHSIALHRIIKELDCIACTSGRERQISQKCHLGGRPSLAASPQLMSRDRAAVLHRLHTWRTLAVLLIHTRSESLNLSNGDFGVMTLVLVLLQMSRTPWMAELSEAALVRCDGSSVCHWGCQGNQGWGWKASMNSFIAKHTHTHASPCL